MIRSCHTSSLRPQIKQVKNNLRYSLRIKMSSMSPRILFLSPLFKSNNLLRLRHRPRFKLSLLVFQTRRHRPRQSLSIRNQLHPLKARIKTPPFMVEVRPIGPP